MNLSRILEKGYLPKELPPPFNSKTFGKKSRYVVKKWNDYETILKTPLATETSARQTNSRYKPILAKYSLSKLFEFNISKGQYSRRKIEIPHPQTYLKLCQEIVRNWSVINQIFALSKFSESRLYSESKLKRSVRTKSKSWGKFKNRLTEVSYNYRVQLKVDISNFYNTIYTHSIPWSLLGKEKSKIYFKLKSDNPNAFQNLTLTDNDAKKYQVGDFIDTLVRNCNDKQSIGFPIGPDTSFVLSEMLASRLDHSIAELINTFDYNCIRYYDDYYFYLNSVGDAETVLKKVQKIFSEYKLEINESKVQIKQLPYFQSDLWNIEIHNFRFKSTLVEDVQELELYFALIFKLIDENVNNSSWIVSYSLSTFEFGKVKVKEEHIKSFLALLLKTAYIDTSSIDQVLKILLSYRAYLTTYELKTIKLLFDKIIKEHILLNHSFEIAWCLWYYKILGIDCEIDTLQAVLDSEDQCSILIALDIINSRGINKNKFDFSTLNLKISLDNLYGKYWLLCYECEIKNWLVGSIDLIKDHEFFKILKSLDITFYDSDAQLRTSFTITRPIAPTNVDDLLQDFFNYTTSIRPENEDDDDDENDDDENGGEY